MEFEWDPKKRVRNIQKHGIDFVAAIGLFGGLYYEEPDFHDDYGEDRFAAYGEWKGTVLVVIYTLRGPNRRIISARKATAKERKEFYRKVFAQNARPN